MTRPALAALLLLATGLAGCQQKVAAPTDRGVCYHFVEREGEEPRFNVVARNQPSIEQCAARLEEMRRKFARLGSRRDVVGAYQGRFLFLNGTDVRTGESLTGGRYVLLIRTPEGDLVMPGAIANPVQ